MHFTIFETLKQFERGDFLEYSIRKKDLLILLVKNNMNQSDLCRKVPIERSYFSRIINGKTLPSEIMAIKIANTLNVDVSEIFEMKEKV